MRDIHPCHCWTITSVTLRTEAEFLWLGIPNCVLLYGIAWHCIYILYGIARAASPIGNLNPLASSYSNVTPLLILPKPLSTARPKSLMLKIKANNCISSFWVFSATFLQPDTLRGALTPPACLALSSCFFQVTKAPSEVTT